MLDFLRVNKTQRDKTFESCRLKTIEQNKQRTITRSTQVVAKV